MQDTEIANEQYIQRKVTHYYDHDGSLVIKARLPAEQGALVVKALEMAMDASFVGAVVMPFGCPDCDPHQAVRAVPDRDPYLEDGPHVSAVDVPLG